MSGSGPALGPAGDGTSLYVHVPFCEVRCPYCHFACFVNTDPELPARFARAVRREWQWHRERGRAQRVETVYFGGGTPSALPPRAREELAAWLLEDLGPSLVPGAEVTLEVNPESARAAELSAWIAAGVNRVSLGVQSMDPQVLGFLGRKNTPASNLVALDLVCSLVPAVSADLIVGSPPDGWPSMLRSLEAIAARPVDHVSAYLLEIHASTRFGRDVAAGRWTEKPDQEQSELYLAMSRWLAERGYEAYELSNFAQPGCHSRHNRRYWSRRPYLGLGPSSHSFEAERRWSNPADTGAWLTAVEAGEPARDLDERLDHRAIRRERVLLGLRTREGVPLDWVEDRRPWWRQAAGAGLLREADGALVCTPEGWLLLDQIVERLVD